MQNTLSFLTWCIVWGNHQLKKLIILTKTISSTWLTLKQLTTLSYVSNWHCKRLKTPRTSYRQSNLSRKSSSALQPENISQNIAWLFLQLQRGLPKPQKLIIFKWAKVTNFTVHHLQILSDKLFDWLEYISITDPIGIGVRMSKAG